MCKSMFFSEDYTLTCPATANPSARRDVANQSCKQTWKAAIEVGPWRAANDAASVTQNVTAITRANSRNPEFQRKKNTEFNQRIQEHSFG